MENFTLTLNTSDFDRIIWGNPSSFIVPDLGSIHCWAYKVTDREYFSKMYAVLSDDEKVRAGNFVFDKDRLTFVYSHGLLRYILASYMNIKPESVQYFTGKNGKPYLMDNVNLQFSLSHSQNNILIAISQSVVGADIEEIRENYGYEEVIGRFFSKYEQAQIKGSRSGLELFYKYWTRKEAFLKATGVGLLNDLQTIEVCFEQNEIYLSNEFESFFALQDFYLLTGRACNNCQFSIASVIPLKSLRFFEISDNFFESLEPKDCPEELIIN